MLQMQHESIGGLGRCKCSKGVAQSGMLQRQQREAMTQLQQLTHAQQRQSRCDANAAMEPRMLNMQQGHDAIPAKMAHAVNATNHTGRCC